MPTQLLPAARVGVTAIYPPLGSNVFGLTAIDAVPSTAAILSAAGVKLFTFAAAQVIAVGVNWVTFSG